MSISTSELTPRDPGFYQLLPEQQRDIILDELVAIYTLCKERKVYDERYWGRTKVLLGFLAQVQDILTSSDGEFHTEKM